MIAVRDWTNNLGPVFAFGVTAIILNFVFFQTRLVPRFISVWGLIGGLLIALGGLISLFVLTADSAYPPWLYLPIIPIAVNEMVLAVWLLVKGFNPTTAAATSPAG